MKILVEKEPKNESQVAKMVLEQQNTKNELVEHHNEKNTKLARFFQTCGLFLILFGGSTGGALLGNAIGYTISGVREDSSEDHDDFTRAGVSLGAGLFFFTLCALACCLKLKCCPSEKDRELLPNFLAKNSLFSRQASTLDNQREDAAPLLQLEELGEDVENRSSLSNVL